MTQEATQPARARLRADGAPRATRGAWLALALSLPLGACAGEACDRTATRGADPAPDAPATPDRPAANPIPDAQRVVQQLPGSGGYLARARDGGLFVAGTRPQPARSDDAAPQDNVAFVQRFAPEGQRAWSWSSPPARSDEAFAIAVDASGHVYLAGRTRALHGAEDDAEDDAFVTKLDPNGGTLWRVRFGTAALDVASAIALDGARVYLAGTTSAGLHGAPHAGDADAFVCALDAARGTFLWTRQLGTPGYDEAVALAVDRAHDVIVAGHVSGALEGTSTSAGALFVRKLDASGATRWTRQLGTQGNEYAAAMALDAEGSLYVGGTVHRTGRAARDVHTDAVVHKLDANGLPKWSRAFGTDSDDRIESVYLAESGELFVAGTTRGALNGPRRGGVDAFVSALDPATGEVSPRAQFGTTGSDRALSLTGHAGALEVGGSTTGSFFTGDADYNVFVRRVERP